MSAEHPLDQATAERRLYTTTPPSTVSPPSIVGAPRAKAASPITSEQLYGHQVLGQHVDQLTSDWFETLGLGAAERAKERNTWEEIARSTGLDDTVLMPIAEGSLQARRAAVRPEDNPEAAASALQQQVAADGQTAREQLRRTYGDTYSEQLFARAEKFVTQHPKLAERLRERGLGSKPEIVLAIAAHVHSTGWR